MDVTVTRAQLPSPKGVYCDVTNSLPNWAANPSQKIPYELRTYQSWQLNDVDPRVDVPQQQNRGDPRPVREPNLAYPTYKPASVTQFLPVIPTQSYLPRPFAQQNALGKTPQTHTWRDPNAFLDDPEEFGRRELHSYDDLVKALVGTFYSS